jgi:hypothetical protein
MPPFKSALLFIWAFIAALAYAQTTDGYVGYDLELEGDRDSVIFATDDTRPGAFNKYPNPDVYLNASGMFELPSICHRKDLCLHQWYIVKVDTIDIQVQNLVSYNLIQIVRCLSNQSNRRHKSTSTPKSSTSSNSMQESTSALTKSAF